MSNKFALDLSNIIERRFSRDYIDMSMAEWMRQNTTLRGRPFSTDGYVFQEAIANDMHPNMDVKKCSQIGLTEIEIRKALGFVTRNRGVTAIFTLADEDMYKRVSQTRIQPLVQKDGVFNLESLTKPVRSMSLMQFGESFLHVTPCTEGDATSTSADAVFNDETDLSDQENLVLFQSRLQNSTWRINQRFSTPTFPAYGVDLGYSASDQRLYKCKCTACGKWNWPQFSLKNCEIPNLTADVDNLVDLTDDMIRELDLVNSYVCCERCRGPLELGNPRVREWVATYPNRKDARGYWVTPFSTSRLNIAYIFDQLMKYRLRNNLKGFYNTVLAETYSDGTIQLPEDLIRSRFTGSMTPVEYGDDVPIRIGIDVGQTCHVVIGPAFASEVFEFRTVPSSKLEDFVRDLYTRKNVVAGAIDRQPYTPTAENIMAITNGRVVPIQYTDSVSKDMLLVRDPYQTVTHVNVNRTQHIDDAANVVRQGIKFSGYGMQQQVIIEHLRDMVREEEPEKQAVWKKLTGQDHYFHALAFFVAATKCQQMMRDLSKDDPREIVMVDIANVHNSQSTLFGSPKRPTSSNQLGAIYTHRTLGMR